MNKVSSLKKTLIQWNKEYQNSINDFKHEIKYREEENEGIFGDEDKKKLFNKYNSLEDGDKNLFALYIILGSARKVAFAIGFHPNYISREINRIKEELKK